MAETPASDANQTFAQALEDAAAPDKPAPTDQPQVDYSRTLEDGFDPSSLPDELAPAYKQMQADYTRKTQEIAEERKFMAALQSDPETQQAVFTQLAESLGYEIENPDQQPPAPEGEQGPLDPRVDQLIEQLEADRSDRETEQYIHAIEQHFATEVGQIQKDAGELTGAEQDALLRLATSLPPDENGMPPVKEAWNTLSGLYDQRQQQYLQSKKDAPPPPTQGQPGQEAEKFDSSEARTEALARAMERASATP